MEQSETICDPQLPPLCSYYLSPLRPDPVTEPGSGVGVGCSASSLATAQRIAPTDKDSH